MAERRFRKGAQVEVTSPEYCLRGTLFPAKIISPHARKRGFFIVEYNSLVTIPGKDLPPKRHREVLPVDLLRPAPPSSQPDGLPFKCGEAVDALVNGGWWEGVVTKELKGGVYSVFFRSVKQEFRFLRKELRAHREWVNGRWSPPLDGDDLDEEEEVSSASGEISNTGRTGKTKRSRAFGTGMLVEVRSDDDGFEGSWYSATVMDRTGPSKFLVRYQHLKADENSSKPLMEEVEADHLRPFPPEAFSIDRYDKHTKVDAYFNDGWWEGEVKRVLDEMKYEVYFEGTDDDLVVHHADLRPHQEWLEGEWVM
ncbi:hypothetical protein MLD38_021265 [Melastoma candidum]|uniref:Uncharacterized protein n=1 Tax=Melastoma candidum TaxID=119954 RepID=A0ACB9QFQ2_9MYRT|nr:hypothetical protein MLD38_021265 [Melastoma candidum]